ncbi:MAG: patatin-like phospholipase family protein [Candidatus Nanopelagicales bacterium]
MTSSSSITSSSSVTPGSTALVLGGGGSAGNAWLVGVVAGLAEGGIDVTTADLVVGTSAGATAAAQLTAAPPGDLLAEVLSAPVPDRPESSSGAQVRQHMDRTAAIIAAASGPEDLRRRLGAAALELARSAGPDAGARWRSIVSSRLPRPSWPRQRVVITAVDAETGDPVLIERSSGIELVDAVAASTSSGAAYPVAGRWLIDGGYRTNADNADAAAGHERVLVLSPLGGRTRTPAEWGLHLADQVDRLREQGSRVEVVPPNEEALAAFGESLMDPTSRPPSSRAGHAQGLALAERVGALWR